MMSSAGNFFQCTCLSFYTAAHWRDFMCLQHACAHMHAKAVGPKAPKIYGLEDIPPGLQNGEETSPEVQESLPPNICRYSAVHSLQQGSCFQCGQTGMLCLPCQWLSACKVEPASVSQEDLHTDHEWRSMHGCNKGLTRSLCFTDGCLPAKTDCAHSPGRS